MVVFYWVRWKPTARLPRGIRTPEPYTISRLYSEAVVRPFTVDGPGTSRGRIPPPEPETASVFCWGFCYLLKIPNIGCKMGGNSGFGII